MSANRGRPAGMFRLGKVPPTRGLETAVDDGFRTRGHTCEVDWAGTVRQFGINHGWREVVTFQRRGQSIIAGVGGKSIQAAAVRYVGVSLAVDNLYSRD